MVCRACHIIMYAPTLAESASITILSSATRVITMQPFRRTIASRFAANPGRTSCRNMSTHLPPGLQTRVNLGPTAQPGDTALVH
jgi:hypothetical protein